MEIDVFDLVTGPVTASQSNPNLVTYSAASSFGVVDLSRGKEVMYFPLDYQPWKVKHYTIADQDHFLVGSSANVKLYRVVGGQLHEV